MNDRFNLRASLEAWEQEAAAYWDKLTRSPEFLSRIGYQMTRNLESQQRIRTSLQHALEHPPTSPELELLARLAQRLDALAERLDRLEAALKHNE